MKIFIEKRTSAKSQKVYTCFVVDLDYTQKVLSFDTNLCAEILGITPRALVEKPVGYKVDISTLLGVK